MKITKPIQDKMVKLYENGKSTVEIGSIFDCSRETVRYHLKKKGIILRKSGDAIALRRKLKKPKHIQKGSYYEISLSQGKVALIDNEDFERINKHNWSVVYERGRYYAMRKAKDGEIGFVSGHKTKTIKMHRVILNAQSSLQIDHINGNGLDNRKANLRIVTNRQNQQNRHHKKSSKYPGVYWNKDREKWYAGITLNGKRKFLGSFDNEEKAFECYKKAVESLGETVLTTDSTKGGGVDPMICFNCRNYDEHNSECKLILDRNDITFNQDKTDVLGCVKFIPKQFHERRIEEIKAQQTISPGGSDELDPIIREIQQGKYAELHIQLKTKDGIKLEFNYPR